MDRSSRSDVDVALPVEVLQNIQLRLLVKAAARTSVLSKSWLHAWSTIPALRLHRQCDPAVTLMITDMEPAVMELEDMNSTLMRYLRDNIPIESFELVIQFEDQDSARQAEKWIRLLATKTRVKELSLTITRSLLSRERAAFFNLPLEILSSESLTKLQVITNPSWYSFPPQAMMTSNDSYCHPVIIKCSSLRELHLYGLHLSQNILDAILSCCSSSLEKVQLSQCCYRGYLNTIKVSNLPRLYELSIDTNDIDHVYTDFVIGHLPNLRLFSIRVHEMECNRPAFNAHIISLAAGSSNVTQLTLDGVITDPTSLDLINSGFPFLESLTLGLVSLMWRSFRFTCASLKSLSLFDCQSTLVDIQLHAPKLSFFAFHGETLPTILLFPISTTLNQLNLSLQLDMGSINASFFLKMRETLTLSRKCHLNIETYQSNQLSLDINIKDVRTRLRLPPATNVQELSFKTNGDKCQWRRSPFFDAFFEICHPNKVLAMPDMTFKHSNHFYRLMLREVLENNYKNKTRSTQTEYWPHHLEHVQTGCLNYQDRPGNWKTLTNSCRSVLDGSTPRVYMYFKLEWR